MFRGAGLTARLDSLRHIGRSQVFGRLWNQVAGSARHSLGGGVLRQRALIVELYAAISAMKEPSAGHSGPGVHHRFQHPVDMIFLRQHAQTIGAAERTTRMLAKMIREAPRDATDVLALRTLEDSHIKESFRKCAVDALQTLTACPAMGHGVAFVLAQLKR